ncbi:hypothetical protein DM785_02260 [Deinococcus actinosclerus]|nr:hypothetical protein DM785_02260 [Deinococcus actinosclerus]
MQDLRLGGTADFSQLFDQLDAVEQRLTDLSKVGVVIKPRLDLGTQLKDLDAYAARLKDLGVTPTARAPRAPAQAPAAPTQANAPVGPTSQDVQRAAELKQRLVEIHNTAAILRNDFIAAGTATNVTDEEVAQLQGRIEALQRELRDVRPIAEQTFGVASREVKNLTLTSAQLQRTLAGATGQMSRLGIASQFKLALDQSSLFQNPQGNVNGIVQLVRGYEQARLSSQSFQKTIQRQNQDLATAETFVQKFADRFNVVPSAVEATIKVLLNNGYTLKQAQETLELYGASALVAAKDVNGAVDALASDVQLGTTVLSNQYGITANQATAWQQYAKSIGVAADALTAEQKAEGFLVQLRKEATNDLREADTILAGVGGNLGEASQEYRRAQQALGEALLPAVTNGAKQLTKFLEAFNELDKPVKDSIANIVVWGTVIAGARIVLSPLISLLRGGVGVFGKIGELAGKKGAAGAINVLDDAAAAAAPKAAQLGKGLKDISEISKQPGLWTKITQGAKGVIGPLTNGAAALGRFVTSLAASPATKGGLYGIVLALGYGVGTLIQRIKTLNGLTIGENVQNFSLKAFSGYSQGQVNDLRIEQARNEAFNKVTREQADALAKAREEKDKDLRASKLRTLQIEKDLVVEQAALGRARSVGDSGAALVIQDRIKNLTTALGLERQNRAVIDANILQQQRLQDLEVKRKPVLDALKKQQEELAKQSETIRIEAKSDFAQDIGKIAQDFRAARRKLENQLKNEKDVVIRAEIQTTIDKLDATEQRAILSRTAEQIRGGQGEVAAAQRAVEDARVAAMKDGAGKRQAGLNNELKSIRDEYGPKIKEALENATLVKGPDRKAFQQQAGSLQRLQAEAEAIARQNAGRDLERIRKEEKDKADEQVRAAQDAQGRVLQAQAQAAEASAQIIDTQRQRQLDAYGTTADARLRIERQFQQADTAAKTQAARLQASQEATQLRRTYDDQMKAARDAGAQRGALEASARQEYLTNLSTLERNAADKVAGIQIDAQNRVRDARLAVQQDALDRELKGINTATGAELAALQTRLKARRAAALASGDARGAEQIDAALKTVETLNTDRILTLKSGIRDAAEGAKDLQQRISDALPKTALGKARSDAASPFNSVIEAAQKRIADLNKAYAQVGAPTPAQTARLRAAVAEQQGVIQRAQVERNRAVLTAEQNTNRELLAGRREQTRAEAEQALKLAQTDQQRQDARLRLLGIDQARLVEVNAELNALKGRTNDEARITALKQEQRDLQLNLSQATQEDRQAAEQLAESLLGITRAQADLLDAQARTDQEVITARQNRVGLAVTEYQRAQELLTTAEAQGKSDAELNALRAARLEAATRLLQAEQSLADLAGQFVDRELAAQQARARAQLRITGAADDAVTAARLDLGITEQQLAADQARLRAADRLGLSDEQRVQLSTRIQEGLAAQKDGEETLRKAQADRLKLAQGLARAVEGLNLESGAQSTGLDAAAARVERAQAALARTRGDVQAALKRVTAGQGLTDDDIGHVNDLTGAIREQRDALKELADEYVKVIENIDSLSSAISGLNEVITPKTKAGGQPFSVQREVQDLTRLQQRRALALTALEQSLATGDPQQITQALNRVSAIEKTYRDEVARLKKEGYSPYLNLVDQQAGRVASGVQAAQGVLDDLLAKGEDNLKAADQLQKDAQAATNDSVPQIAADALARALNTGSERVADQILASLTGGARIVSDSIQRALGAAPPKVAAPTTPPVQAGDTINATYTINWQGQELPTPPDYRDMWNKLLPFAQRWAADQGRRNPCPQR